MHFIVIKDIIKKFYFVLKTPYLPEFFSMFKQKDNSRFRLKIFNDTYSDRVFKLFYVKYLLANKYRYRRRVLVEFLSSMD